jgi:hypothetical protein
MIGYKTSILPITQSHTVNEYLALVPMVTDTVEIAEVIVIPGFSGGLRSIAEGASANDLRQIENARGNLNISTYQGLTGADKTGDPKLNYAMLRQKQKYDAYEKGGIPSDKMLAVSPFMVIPALYLLIKGLPEQPSAPQSELSYKDIERLWDAYRESLFEKKKQN